MTDEPANAEPTAADALIARLDRPLTEMTVDELRALKAEFEARGIAIHNSATTDLLILAAMASPYSKAFLETLGRAHAESLSEGVRTRFRKNRKVRELLVGPKDGAAATLVITSDTPDEARLAVLELNVTAEDLRGQCLRWDSVTQAWRPCCAADPGGD